MSQNRAAVQVAELMAKAEAADKADIPDGMSIPDELARREDRLQKIAETRTKIEARGKVELARRYRGPNSNNGKIPYSVREAAGMLHIGRSRPSAALNT